MQRNPWWPAILAYQLILIQNFLSKIAGYSTVLGLSPAQLTAAQALCEAYIEAFNFTEHSKQTMQSLTKWRNDLFYGEPKGSTPPNPPVFEIGNISPGTMGMVTQFFELRDQILAAPGYTESIGEDLGLIGTEKTEPEEGDVAPELKLSVSAGYWVNVKGSLKGMSGMRIEYRPSGGQYTPIAYFSNTPGSFQITPALPGQPEKGHVRAVFIRKNAQFGDYSPDYPVTVS
jgi:hypothetical protein